MSTKLYISPKWRSLLESYNLKEFNDFFQSNEHFDLLTKETSAKVYKLNFQNEDLTFFLKTNFNHKPRKVIKTFFKGKIYKQPVVKEVENITFLEKKGFPIMKIVAWGEQTQAFWPVKAFVLVEKVEGEEFIDFYNNADNALRKKQLKEFGKLKGTIHRMGIDSIIRPQDLFCKLDPKTNKVQLNIIDREDGSTKNINFTLDEIPLEISIILVKGIIKYNKLIFSTKEALSFCQGYLEANHEIDLSSKELFNLIVKNVNIFLSTRKYAERAYNLLPKTLFGDKAKN